MLDPGRHLALSGRPGGAPSPASQLSTDARTSTGLLMGTPLYMSPEQCRGDVELDGRTDVYALGIMLYQLLEGQFANGMGRSGRQRTAASRP